MRTHLSVPARMKRLALDELGCPVPWYCAWVNGKPAYRVADEVKMFRARRFGYCRFCGSNAGAVETFLISPMSAVLRVSGEPPCHADCADFVAQTYLVEAPPEDPPELANMRCVWTAPRWQEIEGRAVQMYRLGEPVHVTFFQNRRMATRAEVLAAIEIGMSVLRRLAEDDGRKALVGLEDAYCRVLALLPAA